MFKERQCLLKGHPWQELSDMCHLKAIEIISKNLRDAYANNPEGRRGMALGQYIAGMGFSNVGLGLVHAMSHPLSALYNTPHGTACAILLPPIMEYNARSNGCPIMVKNTVRLHEQLVSKKLMK